MANLHQQASIAQLITCSAVSPLGLTIDSTGAALRAQLSASVESEYIDKSGEKALFAFVQTINSHIIGIIRMIELAGVALLPIFEKVEQLKLDYEQVPIFLSLPEPRPGIENIHTFLNQFEGFFEIDQQRMHWHLFHDGHAGGLMGLSAAVDFIRSGKGEFCIVGGVDSYWHPESLAWLDSSERLKSDLNLDGFIPGEAAAFILVTSHSAISRLGLKSQAEVLNIATAMEPNHFASQNICIGQGLTSVLHSVLKYGSDSSLVADWTICDLNGESYRATEWGYAYLRSGDYHRDPLEIWHPADSIGDIGAASGAMFVAIAMNALINRYGRGDQTLIWTSSDHGARSAALMRAVNK